MSILHALRHSSHKLVHQYTHTDLLQDAQLQFSSRIDIQSVHKLIQLFQIYRLITFHLITLSPYCSHQSKLQNTEFISKLTAKEQIAKYVTLFYLQYLHTAMKVRKTNKVSLHS